MNEEVRQKKDAKLADYSTWLSQHTVQFCRIVQYCGVEMVGAHSVLLTEVSPRIESLVCEGFYVDWAEHEGAVYLRVWEFGGPEPAWPKVFAEAPLAGSARHARRP